MGRFYGKIGYGTTSQTTPGVWEESIITERNYYGDVLKLSSRWQTGENLNDELTANNEISVVADPYAYENFQQMRYVVWNGARWKITSVEVQRPRLILRIGGVYNGPTPTIT